VQMVTGEEDRSSGGHRGKTHVLDRDIYKGEDTGNCWRVKEEDTGDHRIFVEKTLEIIGNHRKIE